MSIQDQQNLVRHLYSEEGLSENYEREFDKLSAMRKASMAESYRNTHGLLPGAKTPYCQ